MTKLKDGRDIKAFIELRAEKGENIKWVALCCPESAMKTMK